MSNFTILDCTLRDGGYINDWNFGKKGIERIVDYLEQSGVDIIECGFLEDTKYNENTSIFSDTSQIIPVITPKKPNTMYVAMIALGDIEPDKIPEYDGKSIDGIRITFHKHEWEEEREVALKLMKKGYKVFIQPVGTTTYTDIELIELIEKVNEINPYAFYIVDTLGTMNAKEVLRLFFIIENNLYKEIKIGFHSHNNLQLSFSNAQELLKLKTEHDVIIDSSVFGMGRGAGNLATELIAQYMNDNLNAKYRIAPLLSIIDEYLSKTYKATPWGYSLPYYLAAVNGCHPNYASYLMNKQTINIEMMGKIINEMSIEKRALYDESYIESIYRDFQENQIDDSCVLDELKKLVSGRDIIIIGTGISIITYEKKIKEYIKQNDSIVITINFNSNTYNQDFIFISNQKRFLGMEGLEGKKVIATSNISYNKGLEVMAVDYMSLLGEGREADNAGVMLMTLLSRVGIKKVTVAGLDGFKINGQSNYFSEEIVSPFERQALIQKNEDINRQLININEKIAIQFITPTEYSIGNK